MKKVFKNIFRFIGATLSLVRVIMIIGMLIIGSISVYLIYTAYQITMNQYNESLTWENTSYDKPLAEIEPALVSNVVDTNTVTAAETWNELEDYVNSLDGKGLDRKKADKLMEQATYWQKIYNLDSDTINRLSLYLKIEDAIPEAYSTLNTEKLAKLTNSLYNLELKKTTKAGQQYMKRLAQVVTDFDEAKSIVTNTILSIGTLKDGVWTIPYTYDRSDLAKVLEKIQTMRKFPALGNTSEVLSNVASVLNYNKNAREYFAYQKFINRINNTTRSDYMSVSSIYTYGQALANGLTVKVDERQGFIIRQDSPVTGVYYDGVRLENNVYIRNGTDIIVYIDPIYEPEPVEDPEPEEQVTDDRQDEIPENNEPSIPEQTEQEQILDDENNQTSTEEPVSPNDEQIEQNQEGVTSQNE